MGKKRGGDNVLQFRRRISRSGPMSRRANTGLSTAMIVGVGLVAGGGLGLTPSNWLPSGWTGFANTTASANASPSLCVANVHDGDTIRTCTGERVRIENIDAPEMPGSPKCEDPRRNGWCDYALAERSRDELASFLADGPVTISRDGTDRYGRTLARLSVNGRDAGDHLVSTGLARVWR